MLNLWQETQPRYPRRKAVAYSSVNGSSETQLIHPTAGVEIGRNIRKKFAVILELRYQKAVAEVVVDSCPERIFKDTCGESGKLVRQNCGRKDPNEHRNRMSVPSIQEAGNKRWYEAEGKQVREEELKRAPGPQHAQARQEEVVDRASQPRRTYIDCDIKCRKMQKELNDVSQKTCGGFRTGDHLRNLVLHHDPFASVTPVSVERRQTPLDFWGRNEQ